MQWNKKVFLECIIILKSLSAIGVICFENLSAFSYRSSDKIWMDKSFRYHKQTNKQLIINSFKPVYCRGVIFLVVDIRAL